MNNRYGDDWDSSDNGSNGDMNSINEEEMEYDTDKMFFWATEKGDENLVKSMLLISKHYINIKDDDGYSTLHRAAYEGHVNIMKILLDLDAAVDSRTIDGWTPLHSASFWSKSEAVELLLQYGADVNACTNGGLTPLHLAAKHSNTPNIIQILLMNQKIDCKLKSGLGETPIEIAERSSNFFKVFNLADECINVI